MPFCVFIVLLNYYFKLSNGMITSSVFLDLFDRSTPVLLFGIIFIVLKTFLFCSSKSFCAFALMKPSLSVMKRSNSAASIGFLL